MSNNDDHPRRNLSRHEDNPFIAFRRFADSQVSSLLNTVFTLPATIANHNNAHQAREECLFGRADKRACDKLRELEEEITGLRQEGRESFRVGDVQAVLRTSEELMRLDRSADYLRKGIVEATTQDSVTKRDRRRDADLVEQFANKKGQELGWMWDWGFPRPFDCDNQTRAISKNDGNREMNELEAMLRLQSEVQRMVADFDGKTWDDRTDNHADNNAGTDEPRVWSWSRSWQWPPPNDAEKDAYSPQTLEKNSELKRAGVPWHDAYEDLLREERGEPSRYMRDEPNYEYSHDHEDQHDEPSENDSPFPERTKPAYEHMFPFVDTLSQQDIDIMSKDDPLHRRFLELRQQRRRDYMAQLERDGEEYSDAAEDAYPEDDDDEETEMDAYERLNAAPAQSRTVIWPAPSISQELRKDAQPSILSTLTTTEQIVAPDGSVTTKTMLKKRFADGREESSESVKIQRSQRNESHQEDAQLEAQKPAARFEDQDVKKRITKRPGWFWSS